MKMDWFSELRERQDQKALEKARREGFEAGSNHTRNYARVE
jgi:hypothetical protein